MRELILINTLNLLDKRPQQMAYVGLIVARWAYIEQALAFLYDYLLAQKGPSQECGHPIDGLGVASFGVVRSLRGKLDLLHFAIEWRLGEAVLKKFKQSVGKKFDAASIARNVLAHGLVSLSEDHPDSLVYDLGGNEYVYTESKLLDVVDLLADAHEAVSSFHNIRARKLLQKLNK